MSEAPSAEANAGVVPVREGGAAFLAPPRTGFPEGINHNG